MAISARKFDSFARNSWQYLKRMDDPLQPSVERLIASYHQTGGLNHIDGRNLPSKRGIASLCEIFLKLMYPGFHDEEPIRSAELAPITRHRLREFSVHLEQEIEKSVKLRHPDCPDCEAQKSTMAIVDALPSIRQALGTDLEAAYEGDPAVLEYDEIILAYPFLEAIAVQRLAHELYSLGVPLVPRIMTEWAHSRTGIDIHPGAEIGSHFFIDHGTGVVIGESCIIGDHVKLYHGVTLGAKSFQRDESGNIVKGGKRHPTVEDYVTIYPNSTVLGGETVVGAHTTVGGNVFLMQSVPAWSLVYYEETQLRIIPKRNAPPLDPPT